MECPFPKCNEKCENINLMVNHAFYHKNHINKNNPIICPKCVSSFCDFYKFERHLRTHIEMIPNNRLNVKETFHCPKETCQNIDFKSRADLIRHLLSHDPQGIPCIYENCDAEKITTYNSFKTHFSLHHRHATYENLLSKYRQTGDPLLVQSFNESLIEPMQVDHPSIDSNFLQTEPKHENSSNLNDQLNDLYMTTYLKYTSKYAVQNYVIEEIFNDVVEFININNREIAKIVKQTGSLEPVVEKHTSLLSEMILKVNVFEKTHKKNNTDLAKLIWKSDTQMYAQPEEVQLDDNEKFHYIPILENLKCLLKNDQIKAEFIRKKEKNENEITSFNDSLRFQTNEIFNKVDELSFQLKLYIDAFTTTNPLADLRKKYKLQGLFIYLKITERKKFIILNKLRFIL